MTRPRMIEALLTIERVVRTHPKTIGVLTVLSVAAIAIGHRLGRSDVPMALTYAIPLAVCAYSIGPVAGAATAFAIAVVWWFDALDRGLAQNEAAFIFGVRLFSNFAIVAMGTIAAVAGRAREGYVRAQQELVQFRADLVSAFSHDLRSPLTAIMGYADMARHSVNAAETEEALDRVLANASHLNRLIADMLSAGHDDNSVPLHPTAFAPEGIVTELRTEFDHIPRSQQVAVSWHVEPQTPSFYTDRSKLTSVVRNLVSNAVKFTERGHVTVRIGYVSDSDTHRVEVEDTGIGIPAESVPHLFNRFYRASETQHIGGFGLGLFIVKRFTELLGGTIRVESVLGRGSRFVVTIPHLATDHRERPSSLS